MISACMQPCIHMCGCVGVWYSETVEDAIGMRGSSTQQHPRQRNWFQRVTRRQCRFAVPETAFRCSTPTNCGRSSMVFDVRVDRVSCEPHHRFCETCQHSPTEIAERNEQAWKPHTTNEDCGRGHSTAAAAGGGGGGGGDDKIQLHCTALHCTALHCTAPEVSSCASRIP